MNISEIQEVLTDIESRSHEAHRGRFQVASNSKVVFKDELQDYENLLQGIEDIRTLDAFVAEHQAIIDQYLALRSKVDSIKLPVKSEEVKKEEPAIVNTSEVKEAKTEPVVSNTKDLITTDEKKEEVKVEIVPTNTSEVPLLVPGAQPSIDQYSYRLGRGEIIQDLPINDRSEQTFKTAGMSSDAIKESQDKINAIPVVDPKKYVDPIQAEIDRRKAEWDKEKSKPNPEPSGYVPMTPEEIEAAKQKIKPAAPMTDEEIEASRKKIGETDPNNKKDPEPAKEPTSTSTIENKKDKKKGKKRKVTKRRRFDWKNNFITQGFNKAYLVIKGLVFSENMAGRTKDYVNACIALGNYRASYKNRTPDVNVKELEAIDRSIASSTMLTLEEKKRLYKKMTKLARQVERRNGRQQAQAIKDSKDILEELSEVEGRSR